MGTSGWLCATNEHDSDCTFSSHAQGGGSQDAKWFSGVTLLASHVMTYDYFNPQASFFHCLSTIMAYCSRPFMGVCLSVTLTLSILKTTLLPGVNTE